MHNENLDQNTQNDENTVIGRYVCWYFPYENKNKTFFSNTIFSRMKVILTLTQGNIEIKGFENNEIIANIKLTPEVKISRFLKNIKVYLAKHLIGEYEFVYRFWMDENATIFDFWNPLIDALRHRTNESKEIVHDFNLAAGK